MSDEEMSETSPPISPSRWPGTPTSPFRWSDPSTQAMLRHFLSTNQISLETYQCSEQMMCSPSGVASPVDLRPLSPLWNFPEENGFKSAGNYKAYGAQEASSSTTRCDYQVYLSFKGEDTRITFTSHLYTAFTHTGILAFRDDDIKKGDNISLELRKAIQASTVSIVVVSKNYAFSDWCLDELVMILECRRTSRHTVLPVFYDVDPSQVRKLRGSFKKAFERHEKRFETKIGERKNEWLVKVEGWRAALRELADLSGMIFNDDESVSAGIEALTHAVVQQVSIQDTQLNNPSYEEKGEEFVKNWAEAFAPLHEHPEVDMKDMEHIETSQMVNACESQIAVASSGKHDMTETLKCKHETCKISMEHTETAQAIYASESQNAVAFSGIQDLISIQHTEISQAIYDSESQNAVTFSGEQDPISIEHPQNSQAVYDSERPNVVTFSGEQNPISMGHTQKSQAVYASESQNAVTFSGEQDLIFIEHPQNSQVYDTESPNVVTFSQEQDPISSRHTQKSQVVNASESQNVVAFPGKQVLISITHTETSQAMYARESQNAVVFSGKQNRRKALKPKCGISDTTISLDVLKQCFHMRLGDAAKSLNVSRSTLKRICRQHNIPWWPNHKRHMLNHVTGFVEGATRAPPAEGLSLHPPDPIELHQQDSLTAPSNFTCEIHKAENISPACNTSSSDHRQAKLVGASVSGHQELHEQTRKKRRSPIDSSFESNPLNLPSLDLDSKQATVTHAHEIPYVKTKLDAGTVTMKATYGEDMIKFQFSSTSGIDELKQEVATRLMLGIDSFNIKYLDDENDWILIGCEADLKLCMDTASSPGNHTTIKLQVHKSKRQLKRKR